MYFFGTAVVVLGVASQATASPHSRRVVPRASPSYTANQARADAVKEAFQTAWDGYYKYAFPHDSLLPVTNGFSDDRLVLQRVMSFLPGAR